jgi:hypothetical protein
MFLTSFLSRCRGIVIASGCHRIRQGDVRQAEPVHGRLNALGEDMLVPDRNKAS